MMHSNQHVMKPQSFCMARHRVTTTHHPCPSSLQGNAMSTWHCYHLSFTISTKDVQTDASCRLHNVQQHIHPIVSHSHTTLQVYDVRVPRYLCRVPPPSSLHHKTYQRLELATSLIAYAFNDMSCRLRVAKRHISNTKELTRTRIRRLPLLFLYMSSPIHQIYVMCRNR